MSILVVGTIAYDSVETPEGSNNHQLGGSAVYFSLSASYFSEVKMVGIVGKDFKKQDMDLLKSHGINTEGIEISDGKTFTWIGDYKKDINQAITIDTQLNVLNNFNPDIDSIQSNSKHLFLANFHPTLQKKILNLMSNNLVFTALDTMNIWIENTKTELNQLIKNVDALIINENEVKTLTNENNYFKAAMKILKLGPKIIVIKRGEYGATLFSENFIFSAPAFPIKRVIDPTGAGDSFAGGFMGYLDKCEEINEKTLKSATIIGSVMASFTVEQFGTKKLSILSKKDIYERFKKFIDLTKFNEKLKI